MATEFGKPVVHQTWEVRKARVEVGVYRVQRADTKEGVADVVGLSAAMMAASAPDMYRALEACARVLHEYDIEPDVQKVVACAMAYATKAPTEPRRAREGWAS